MGKSEWISYGAAALWLLPCAFLDRRSKKIPVLLGAGGSMAAFLWFVIRIITGEEIWTDLIPAVVPGGLMLMLSVLTDQKIGIGDGVVLLGIGFLLGCRETFLTLLIALFLSAVYSGILLVSRRVEKNACISWMPFLLIGLLADWVIKANL